MDINKIEILKEIKAFLDGYNDDLKYLVNVETDGNNGYADCVIHEPNMPPTIRKVKYEAFMYMKDISKFGLQLYPHSPEILPNKLLQYNVKIVKLKTGNQKRLADGYCYKLSSSKSYNSIINFLRDGRVNPFEKFKDEKGKNILDKDGKPTYIYRDLFYSVHTTDQFFISNKCRLFKGIDEYSDVHRVTFDIETSGLRHQSAEVFAIGIRDNRGFEKIIEVDKLNDPECEIKINVEFFKTIVELKPAIVSGYNSEFFDFEFILGRLKLLGIDVNLLETTLHPTIGISRKINSSVKYGNRSDKYTATKMWGISVIDTIHAAKRTAAINSDIREVKLKYIAKFEKIAKPNRTYVNGEGNDIYNFYKENKVFMCDERNNYIVIPDEHQTVGLKLYTLQANKKKVSEERYKQLRNEYLSSDKDFVTWFREHALPKNMIIFTSGKRLIRQYLLDDLWETEKVDELYNQSAFMLAKIVPTTFHRICTMGTASVWNLLLTAWSYENDLAIPHPDVKVNFSGGLARCYKIGYTERWVKIDYASLYPMLQLTNDIFPVFDITGVTKKMLLYLTTTRNIYKKLANGTKLNEEEVFILEAIDHDTHRKYVNCEIIDADLIKYKIKQLPIKILNNSLFGALGSDRSFNWSDNMSAARITGCGRLSLRQAVAWFKDYDCDPLLAVTDGVNFQIPLMSNIALGNSKLEPNIIMEVELPIEQAWIYNGKTGIAALIEKYNAEEMVAPYMLIDNDGEYLSCLNLSRINYATLSLVKDKKTGEMVEKVRLTGNTIKSQTMPEYIEEFIDIGLDLILHGKGYEFYEYYKEYVEQIYYKRIPLKKIASKNKVKDTLIGYTKRGNDKNGREKGKKVHMELLIEQREKMVEVLFEKHKHEFDLPDTDKELTYREKLRYVSDFMPPEPEMDTVIYTVNTGYMVSHGASKVITDKVTGKERFAATMIDTLEMKNNPDLLGDYNVAKYLSAFNKKVMTLLPGFKPETAKKFLSKIVKTKVKNELGKSKPSNDIKHADNISRDEFKLMNFELDNIEQSMYLEPREVGFWNRYGYDPRLIWDGFMVKEDMPVLYNVYQDALDFLNVKMMESNKPLIKSVNEERVNGDLVLLKDDDIFSIGLYDGVYLNIIRDDVDVPRPDKAYNEDDVAEGEMPVIIKVKKIDPNEAKRIEYFDAFRKYKGFGDSLTLDVLVSQIPNFVNALDYFIADEESNDEEMLSEYGIDIDD